MREFAKTFCAALAEAAPDKFTVAMPKPQRRGRICLDFLSNHPRRPIMPYSARARGGVPVAAPVRWDELQDFERADAFAIADAELLLKRARKMKRWGAGAEALPRPR